MIIMITYTHYFQFQLHYLTLRDNMTGSLNKENAIRDYVTYDMFQTLYKIKSRVRFCMLNLNSTHIFLSGGRWIVPSPIPSYIINIGGKGIKMN